MFCYNGSASFSLPVCHELPCQLLHITLYVWPRYFQLTTLSTKFHFSVYILLIRRNFSFLSQLNKLVQLSSHVGHLCTLWQTIIHATSHPWEAFWRLNRIHTISHNPNGRQRLFKAYLPKPLKHCHRYESRQFE